MTFLKVSNLVRSGPSTDGECNWTEIGQNEAILVQNGLANDFNKIDSGKGHSPLTRWRVLTIFSMLAHGAFRQFCGCSSICKSIPSVSEALADLTVKMSCSGRVARGTVLPDCFIDMLPTRPASWFRLRMLIRLKIWTYSQRCSLSSLVRSAVAFSFSLLEDKGQILMFRRSEF